jgi:hypothetical protein
VYSFGVLAYEMFALRIPFDFAITVTLYHAVGTAGLRLQMPPCDPPQADPLMLHAYTHADTVNALITDCFADASGRPSSEELCQRLRDIEGAERVRAAV